MKKTSERALLIAAINPQNPMANKKKPSITATIPIAFHPQ
jgi:hypothetical protein